MIPLKFRAQVDITDVLAAADSAADVTAQDDDRRIVVEQPENERWPANGCHGAALDTTKARDATKNLSGVDSTHGLAAATKKRAKKEKDRLRRAKKRRLMAEANGDAVPEYVIRHVRSVVEKGSIVPIAASKDNFKAATGWTGETIGSRLEGYPEKNGQTSEGFKLVEWDGTNPTAIADVSGKVAAVLVGRARGPSFEDVLRDATAVLREQSSKLCSENVSMQGFYAVTTGISFGRGQQKPMQSVIPLGYTEAVAALTSDPAVIRLASFQDSVFKNYFPVMYQYYKTSLESLCKEYPNLSRPFSKSVMPAATFNLGPQTVYAPHRDSTNLSFGICSITAMGDFNPDFGGHLLLKEASLKIRFPPGSTVLIPSAAFTHSNTPIQEGERRYSFTQHAAGMLFSFVENGMKAYKAVQADPSLTSEMKLRWIKAGETERLEKGLKMFPHISEYGDL